MFLLRLIWVFVRALFKRSAWERNTASAEQHNEPGRFTALIGL